MRKGNEGSKFMLFLMIWSIFALFAIVFALGIASVILDREIDEVLGILSSPWGLMFSQFIMFIVPLALWIPLRGEKFKPNFPSKKLGGKNIIILVVISFLIQPLMMFISGISAQFFTNDVAALMYNFQRYPFVLQLIAIAVTPAICEELVFRGYIQEKYRNHTINKAALINGLFFAIIHLNLQQFAYAFAMGVIFAYAVHYTRSIWAGIIPHFIVNGTQVTLSRVVHALPEPYVDQYAEELLAAIPLSDDAMGIIMLGVISLVLTPVVYLLFRELAKHNSWRVAGEVGQAGAVVPQVNEQDSGLQFGSNPMPDWANPGRDAFVAPGTESQYSDIPPGWQNQQHGTPTTPEWQGQQHGTPTTPEWQPYQSTYPAPPHMHTPDKKPSRVDPFFVAVVVVFVLFMVLTAL